MSTIMSAYARNRLSQINYLFLFLIFLLCGLSTPAVQTEELTDMTTDFLEGKVHIIDFNYKFTRFRLVENGALVDVRNDIHIRLVDNPYNLPSTFPIIAPMTAVEVVEGQVLPTYIHKYTLKHYLSLREKYERFSEKISPGPPSEKIINKKDADYIFSLNRTGWEAYAQKMIHPEGWKVRFGRHDTGTSVMAFDPNTSMGLSIQPLYENDDLPPTIIIVGSYYPLGSLPAFTDDFKRSLEKEAGKDLGPAYSVSASYSKMPPFEGIELMIMKK